MSWIQRLSTDQVVNHVDTIPTAQGSDPLCQIRPIGTQYKIRPPTLDDSGLAG
jgi:hypothetical protein